MIKINNEFYFKHSREFDEDLKITQLLNYSDGSNPYLGYFYLHEFEVLLYTFYKYRGLPVLKKDDHFEIDYSTIKTILSLDLSTLKSLVDALIKVQLIDNNGKFSQDLSVFFKSNKPSFEDKIINRRQDTQNKIFITSKNKYLIYKNNNGEICYTKNFNTSTIALARSFYEKTNFKETVAIAEETIIDENSKKIEKCFSSARFLFKNNEKSVNQSNEHLELKALPENFSIGDPFADDND